MIRNSLAIVILWSIINTVAAQNPAKFADLNESPAGMYNLAMGNTGVSSSVDVNALFLNPALLTKFKKVNFAIGANSIVPLTGPDRKNYFVLNDGMLNNVALGIPIAINDFKMALAFSYRPAYNWSEKTLDVENGIGLLNESSAGPKVISFGMAFSSFDEFSIGLSYNKVIGDQTFNSNIYNFGTNGIDLRDINIDDFNNTVLIEESYTFSYNYWELGASSELFGRLKLGAKIRTPYIQEFETKTTTTKYDYPIFYTIGSELKLGRIIYFDVDYQNHDYTKVKVSGTEKPGTDLFNYKLNNFRFGLKFSGYRGGYFAMGYQHKKYMEEDIDGNQNRTHAVSLGFGTPIGKVVWRNAAQVEITNFDPDNIFPKKLWVGTEFIFFFKSKKQKAK